MALPTPPSTAHRAEKENRQPRVAWAEENSTHLITGSPPRTPKNKSRRRASDDASLKSILKPSFPMLPWAEEEIRQLTPEPVDVLSDLDYLEGPVSMILAVDASMRDLIQGYSKLADRLRTAFTEDQKADSSLPLFAPLHKNREAIVEAITRDLGRAFIDPQLVLPAEQGCSTNSEDPSKSLPSPQGTPKKKKGMSAEQVKYARDLCSTCHSVIKLLSTMFIVPALYQIFTGIVVLGCIETRVSR